MIAVLWPQIICIDMDHAYFGAHCPYNTVLIHEKRNEGMRGYINVENRDKNYTITAIRPYYRLLIKILETKITSHQPSSSSPPSSA